MAAILKSKMAASVGTTVMSTVLKWYKLTNGTAGKLRFHGSSFLLCIESGYVEWHAFTVAAILKSNMAAT
jgi:predicted alternative tryptophan synthase beta-subunit